MKTRLAHLIIRIYYRIATRKREWNLRHPEELQRLRLSEIVSNLSKTEQVNEIAVDNYESFTEKFPVTDYLDYVERVETQRKTGRRIISSDVARYEPTSGSTSARKWIPYSRAFLGELNQASTLWIDDIYQNFPGTRGGVHYWSLSWLPTELRELASNDDADLFPAYQRWLLRTIMAVPSNLGSIATPEAAWWATLVMLCSRRDLTLISVWSPTFLIRILDDILENWSEIQLAVTTGTWQKHEDLIQAVIGSAPSRKNVMGITPQDSDFFSQLWPELFLVSCWASSTSAIWNASLQKRLPHVAFQGKGLWATEGVVSIPLKTKTVLSLSSHFLEFRDLETLEVMPAWKIQEGAVYQPLLTTSSGLIRYALRDRVRVSGWLEKTPAVEFCGRISSTDLVGEKIESAWVEELFERYPEWKAICLIAVRAPTPHYILIQTGKPAYELERELNSLHHYKVASELKQLASSRFFAPENLECFFEQFERSGIKGQNKVELLFEKECVEEC